MLVVITAPMSGWGSDLHVPALRDEPVQLARNVLKGLDAGHHGTRPSEGCGSAQDGTPCTPAAGT